MLNVRLLKIFVWALSILFLILLFVRLGLAPLKTLQKIEIANTVTGADSIYFATSYDSLIHVYAFKQAMLELAAGDSIQLVLNLPDSQAILFIHGVPIFSSKLSFIYLDPLLKTFSNQLYAETFSHPLTLSVIWSTMVKEPIIVREAPKDVEEASSNAYMPDTLIQHPAFVKLSTSIGINIFMDQTPNPNINSKWTLIIFRLNHWLSRANDLVQSAIFFESFEYQPQIVVKLPADDLRAIYRALPNDSPVLVIRY